MEKKEAKRGGPKHPYGSRTRGAEKKKKEGKGQKGGRKDHLKKPTREKKNPPQKKGKSVSEK